MTVENQQHALEDCLRAVWWRTQRMHLAAGLLALCRWIVPLFLLAMAVDRFAYLPGWARATAMIVLSGISFFQAWRHGWRNFQRFDATRTALEIEGRRGGMDSLLVTAVQFARSGTAPGTSESMWALTRRRAEEAAAGWKAADIVSFKSLRRPLKVVLVLGAVLLGFAVLNGPFLGAGIARFFTPWLAVSYPTKTKIDPGMGDLVVKEGERARIEVKLSGVIPKEAELDLQTGAGRPREMSLDVADGRCEYVINSASRDFTYRIKAGDARSGWHQVRVIPAPRIERVEVKLEYPPYIGREVETVGALTLTVPENTKVRWHLTLDRPVREAVLHRDGADPFPLEVDDDGRQLVLDEAATASRGYSFSWVEKQHGFDFTSPRYYLQVAGDQAPRVELTTPESNLQAMLGRPLELAIRAQDDHGLGPATITCRVNQRPEKTVTLDQPVRNGQGEQALDWDYREALPDLQVGDTVSFVVEVRDRYPGEGGPHRARTESRRITFLSREDYLAQIGRQMDRLLSRVRTIYRQEREAHELVRGLDPGSDSFIQTCQLEAVRQEMMREQLVATAREVRALLDDLAANNVTDAVESVALEVVGHGLETIASDQMSRAASLLREQAGAATSGKVDPGPAIRVVNDAARALAGLVLQRGIDPAREVFARESRMLAREQAYLRADVIEGGGAETLAARQEEVAGWTRELMDQLEAGMRYDQRPLAVLALTRRIKELRAAAVEESMREAAVMIRGGKVAEVAAVQAAVVLPLLEAEFGVRTGAEFAAVLELSDLLDSLLASQRELRGECENASDVAPLVATQSALREQLLLAMLPSIPAPRARLMDDRLPMVPPARDLRFAAERSMADAVALLRAGDKDTTLAHQQVVVDSLAQLRDIVDRWSVEVATRTQGHSRVVSDATDRLTRIEEFETRQISLLEKTEEAALDEKNPEQLAEPQEFLADELARFRKDLAGDGEPAQDALPLLSRIDRVSVAMAGTARALREKRPEDALENQERAADILAEARELGEMHRARLGLLQELFTFQQAVGFASDSMGDIVDEQRDLARETASADEEKLEKLMPKVRNLRQCLVDVAPVLDLVAGRLDAGTPLLFAGSDLDDAIDAMEDGDAGDAADIQDGAAEPLDKVRGLVEAVKTQTGYVAEIVEFLHEAEAGASLMAFHQGQIREKTAALHGPIPKETVSAQESLRSMAAAYGLELRKITGMDAFAEPGGMMGEAVTLLREGRTADATARMELAERALTENAEQLFLVITMLHGLPGILVDNTSPPGLKRLLDVLDVASAHQRFHRGTQQAGDDELKAIAAGQRKLEQRLATFAMEAEPHPMLVSAHAIITNAAGLLETGDREQAIVRQRAADEVMRHFIIEQALILETAKAAASSSDEPVLSENETTDLYESKAAGFVSDFVSGEAPKDKRSEWEVLGTRNRAALNQNFARELPLEYRATLKNYYERVAK